MDTKDVCSTFNNNIGLAAHALNAFLYGKHSGSELRGLDRDDLYQCSCIGLWRALGTHDPDKGALSTHAQPKSFGAMQLACMRDHIVRPPIEIQKKYSRYAEYENRTMQNLGREPTPADLIYGTNAPYPQEEMEDIYHAMHVGTMLVSELEENDREYVFVAPTPTPADGAMLASELESVLAQVQSCARTQNRSTELQEMIALTSGLNDSLCVYSYAEVGRMLQQTPVQVRGRLYAFWNACSARKGITRDYFDTLVDVVMTFWELPECGIWSTTH